MHLIKIGIHKMMFTLQCDRLRCQEKGFFKKILKKYSHPNILFIAFRERRRER